MIFVTNKIKKLCQIISIVAVIVFSLFLPCLAQAAQGEEAAAINAFKTFVKYVTTEDPRTFSMVSELTKAVTAEAAADVVMDNPQFREMCAGMSRSDIVQELRAEFENPAQETASNFAKEMKAKLAVFGVDLEKLQYNVRLSGQTADLYGKDGKHYFVMVKENGQWKVGLIESFQKKQQCKNN